MIFDQLEKNLAGRRCGWIDINEIAVAWIARVMVDVDPNFRRADGLERGAKPILDGGVECDCNIDILRDGGWFGQKFRAGKKGIFFEHSIFIPDADVFAELLE